MEFLEYYGILKGLFQKQFWNDYILLFKTCNIRDFCLLLQIVVSVYQNMFSSIPYFSCCAVLHLLLLDVFSFFIFIPFMLINWLSLKSNAVARLYKAKMAKSMMGVISYCNSITFLLKVVDYFFISKLFNYCCL